MNLSQFFLILHARYKIILLTLVVTVITALLVSLSLPKTYKAVSTVLLTHTGKDPVTGMLLPMKMMPGYMATQLDVIHSTSTALIVVDRLKLDQSEAIREQFEDNDDNRSIRHQLADLLLNNLSIDPSRDSSVISINYRGSDPVFVAVIANAFADAYQEKGVQLSVEPSKKAAAYFTDQIDLLRDNLVATQRKLSQYQQDKGIINVDNRLDIETTRLNELSSQLVMAQSDMMGTMSDQGGTTQSQGVATNSLINTLKASLAQAEANLADLSQRLGKNHPSYEGARAEVSKIRQELNRHSKATAGNAVSREADVRAALEDQKTKVLALNKARGELQLLVREVEGAQNAYDNATLRFNQTRLEGQSNLSSISVLDPAVPSSTPDSPNIVLNMFLSVFLGTILGLGFSFLAEMLDRRVRSTEDLVETLQAPVLGVISWNALPPKSRRLRLFFAPLLRLRSKPKTEEGM